MRASKRRLQNKKQLVLNGATFLLFQIIFWACNFYPRHLLEINGLYSILATLLNSIYYVLYFFFILMVFRKNTTLFSEKLFYSFEPLRKRFCFKQMGLLLMLQLVLDVANMLLDFVSDGYRYGFSDLITMVSWLVVYFIAAEKEHNMFRKRKTCVVAAVILAGMLIAACVVNIYNIFKIGYLSNKYLFDSDILQASLQNIAFEHTIVNLFLDTGVGLTLIILHMVQHISKFASDDEKGCDESQVNSFYRVACQIGLLFLASFFMVGMKMLIYPCSSLRYFKWGDTGSTVYVNTEVFHIATKCTEQIRIDKNWEEIACYRRIKNIICFDNAAVASFNTIVEREPQASISGNTIQLNDFSEEYDIGGTEVKIYKDFAICFVQEDTPVVILLDDINTCEENPVLTQTCEELLLNGNVSIFEYGCDYLRRYGSQVIEDCINRYTSAEFTEQEQAYMENMELNPDFIVQIAREQIR